MDNKTSRLLNDLVEQRLEPEQAAELNRLLQSDAEAAQQYLQLLRVHHGLAELAAPVRAFSGEELRAMKAVEDRFGAPAADARTRVDAPESTEPAASNRAYRRSLLALFALAASTLVAIGLWAPWSRQAGPAQVANDPPTPPAVAAEESTTESLPLEDDENVVAHVIRKIDCDWEADRWSVATSPSITAGQQINLSRGLLVLQFTSGVELTLNGPAALVATSDKSARLLTGELSARVAPQGRGFKVETHAGDFVDLGTEFGLIVTRNGAVESHVFRGEVVAKPIKGGEAGQEILLETGNAWRRAAGGASEAKIVADARKFLRSEISTVAEELHPPPVDRQLAMWFNASSRVQRDSRDRVSAWGDIPSQSNTKPDNAWQVTASRRPQWIADAIGGRPAFRFDGYKGLVTEPMELGGSHTSAVVFQVDRQLAQSLVRKRNTFKELGVQLLNFNGPPHPVLQVNEGLRIEARVHLGLIGYEPEPVDVGFVLSARPLTEGPHVAVYSFDAEQGIAQLFVDGELLGESRDVPKLGSTTSPRYIGAHYDRSGFGFAGDIAEVLVYQCALEPAESVKLSSWLSEKYRLLPRVAELQAAPAAGVQ